MIDFLDWKSDISLDQVFAQADAISYPHLLNSDSGDLLYLTALKEEKSRAALMLQSTQGTRCITPSPFSLRTKVNEYGGKPYWVFDKEIIFANQADQCLYRQVLEEGGVSEPSRLTPQSDGRTLSMYTDVNRVGEDHYIAILESENLQDPSTENVMCIAVLNAAQNPLEATALIHGADFYSNLVISKDARRVAWVQWNHPNMPWDETELWVAEVSQKNGQLQLVNSVCVALGDGASVCQLIFSEQGQLFFSADYPTNTCEPNYWNVHCFDFDSGQTTQTSDQALEFGYPHWVYGDQRVVQINDHTLLLVGSAPEDDRLFALDTRSLKLTQLNNNRGTSATTQHLSSDGKGKFIAVQLDKDRSHKLIEAELLNGELVYRDRVAAQVALKSPSIAEHVHYKTRDGAEAYGFFYPPSNPVCQSKTDPALKPPLIVLVHGGPTARAYGHFDIQKQFWTSRGFALFDVNHRGSSGYGRKYRDALYQHWGELDASDIIDGIEMLIDAGKVDRERVCIRGKSAGGYAVLRALTEYPDYFKAGACYYGIGNLVTLAETTHKFEKCYTDRLIGETFDRKSASYSSSRFYQRSPIHKMDQVKSAMIIFQGLMDKVVPPSVAQEVIDVLRNTGVEHAYVEYEGEGHGFRQTETNIDAWGKELEFYQRVLYA